MKWSKARLNKLAKRYNALVEEGRPIYVNLCREFKASERTIRRYISELRAAGKVIKYRNKVTGEEGPKPHSVTEGYEQAGKHKGEYFVEAIGPRVKTLKQLMEVCSPDMKKYTCDSHVVNMWEGHAKIDGKMVRYENWQVKAWFKLRKPQDVLENLADEIMDDFRQKAPSIIKKGRVRPRGEQLLEIGLFDFHLGNLVWHEENAEDWDTHLAEKVFMEAVSYLLDEAATRYKPSRILFPIGNDFFHVDNRYNQTTAGTQLDMDTRWSHMVRLGVKMHKWALEVMRQLAPVDVLVIPGNHDEHTSQTLGFILEAWFGHCNDITIDVGPRKRKYYDFGQTLFGFTHGKYEPKEKLPNLMAGEEKERWGRTTWREFHIGHRHHKRAERFVMDYIDDEGVIVRTLPTLAAVDSHHTDHGWTGAVKAAEAYVFDYDRGLLGTLNTQRDQMLRS